MEKLKKFLITVWKPVIICLLIGIIIFAICVTVANVFEEIKQIASICLAVDVLTIVFCIPSYLCFQFIRIVTSGWTQKILYCVWAYFMLPVVIVPLSIFSQNATNKFAEVFATVTVLVLMIGIPVFLVLKFICCAKHPNVKKERSLAVLKGIHIYGLPMCQGTKISIQLYEDKILFKYKNIEINSVYKTDIISASLHSEQDIVGTTTTATRKTGVASTLALLNGDLATAYLLSPKAITYETKNNTVVNWYFILDTSNGDIAINIKSIIAGMKFIDMCNDMISSDSSENDICKEVDADKRLNE